MSPADNKTFAAHVHNPSLHEIADLRVGKKTDALYGYVEKLYKQDRPLRLLLIAAAKQIYRAAGESALRPRLTLASGRRPPN